jgi:hypothetical protein
MARLEEDLAQHPKTTLRLIRRILPDKWGYQTSGVLGLQLSG